MNWKRSGIGLMKVMSRHLLRGPEENHEHLGQYSYRVPHSFTATSTYSLTHFRFPAEVRALSLDHGVLTGSGAEPTSYPMGIGGLSPGGKSDHSPPPLNVEVKNEWCDV